MKQPREPLGQPRHWHTLRALGGFELLADLTLNLLKRFATLVPGALGFVVKIAELLQQSLTLDHLKLKLERLFLALRHSRRQHAKLVEHLEASPLTLHCFLEELISLRRGLV